MHHQASSGARNFMAKKDERMQERLFCFLLPGLRAFGKVTSELEESAHKATGNAALTLQHI